MVLCGLPNSGRLPIRRQATGRGERPYQLVSRSLWLHVLRLRRSHHEAIWSSHLHGDRLCHRVHADHGGAAGARTKTVATQRCRPRPRVCYRARYAQMQPCGFRGVPPAIWPNKAAADAEKVRKHKSLHREIEGPRGGAFSPYSDNVLNSARTSSLAASCVHWP